MFLGREPGKLPKPSIDATATDGETKSRRLFLHDKSTKSSVLINTGAEISVIPPSLYDLKNATSHILYSVNQEPIRTYGERMVTMNLGLRRPIKWAFCIADVPYPIIGADLLGNYGFVVDIKQGLLIDPETEAKAKGTFSNVFMQSISAVNFNNKFADILKGFPELLGNPSNSIAAKNPVRHHIKTTGPPCAQRVRQLRPELLKKAKEEFQIMLDMGIMRPSSSQWASPLHMVPKKNGDWRPFGDFRKLNDRTEPDQHPISLLTDCTWFLAGKKIFSKIDLKRAYNHIRVAEEGIPKTAIITPFGLFESVYLPYGLRNAAQSFQRHINEVIRGLKNVFAFSDDILVASETEEEHEEQLRALFERLKQYGLCLNADKCIFGASSIDFLGYRLSAEGASPLPDRVQALLDYKKPDTIVELRRFIGAVNFYRRNVKNAAEAQAPLNELLKDSKKNDKRPVPWTEKTSIAFEKVKEQLAHATLLAHPVHGAELRLVTDASSTAIGASIEQRVDGNWQPLGFFSRKLTEAQKKYSTYDRELTAVFEAVKYFQHWLEGRNFAIVTDHKPLIYAFQ